VAVGVDEAWCDHTIASIDDSIYSPVVVLPDVLNLTAVDDYAPISENVMLITLNGDNESGVDPDALRHEVPPYNVHGSPAMGSGEGLGRADLHHLQTILSSPNI
jgi:hypothetical protein